MSRNLYLTQSQISARLKRLINVVAFYIKFSYYNCDYSVLIAKFIIQRISFFKDSFLRKFSSFYLRGIFKPNLEFYIIFCSKFISCFSKYFSFSSIYYFFLKILYFLNALSQLLTKFFQRYHGDKSRL